MFGLRRRGKLKACLALGMGVVGMLWQVKDSLALRLIIRLHVDTFLPVGWQL